jgi:predicted nucleotidyltransferase
MGKKIVDPLSIKDELLGDLQRFHGDNLVSVILYGSALTPDYVPGTSDINILVIVKDRALSSVGHATGYHPRWEKRNVHISFYLTASFIEASLDAFPIEYLNIKSHYEVLMGEDVLAGLAFDPAHIRLQCERELRGKSVHLRRAFLVNSGKARQLQAAMKLTLKDYIPVFKAMLYLKEAGIPDTRAVMIQKFVDIYGIESDILQRINGENFGNSLSECIKMFYDYSAVVDHLILEIDRMAPKKE